MTTRQIGQPPACEGLGIGDFSLAIDALFYDDWIAGVPVLELARRMHREWLAPKGSPCARGECRAFADVTAQNKRSIRAYGRLRAEIVSGRYAGRIAAARRGERQEPLRIGPTQTSAGA